MLMLADSIIQGCYLDSGKLRL